MKNLGKVILVVLSLALAACGSAAAAPAATSITSDLITKGPWLDARAYKTLAAADAAAVSAGKLLLISTQWNTVPAELNAAIKVIPGGKLNGTGSVAINGPFEGCAGCFGTSQMVTGLMVAAPELWKPNLVPGTTDMAAAIRAADSAVSAAGRGVVFEAEEYLVNSELKISVPWYGTPGKTKITIGTDFTRTTTYSDPFDFSYVWNKNFSKAGYNSATADYVRVDGIHFQLKKNATKGTILNIANVRGGSITNCRFDSVGVNAGITNLDLYASVKNFIVEGNDFRNETTATFGGNIWVRNITTDAANSANATENVTITNNSFVKNSGDESIAVTGVFSLVRNVRVENNRFVASGTTHGALLVVGLDPNPSYTATAEARDVQFIGNHIVTSATLNEVMRSGVAGDNSDKLNDIIFQGNTILYDAPSTGTRAGIRQVAGRNVKAIANNIYNVGTTYAVQRGLYLMDEARDNTIKDLLGATVPMVTAIDGGTLAVGNVIDVGGIGVQNCSTVTNNIIKAVSPFAAQTTSQYDAIGNRFEIAGSGVSRVAVIYNSLGGSVAPSGRLIGNTIICNDAANHRPVLIQGTGRVEMVDNRITGTGTYTYGGPLKYARGNEYYGALFDDAHTSSAIDGDLRGALPVGHFIRNIGTMTVDGSGNLLTGWIKLTAGTLQAVYQKTTSP